jgi:hypothetical protein
VTGKDSWEAHSLTAFNGTNPLPGPAPVPSAPNTGPLIVPSGVLISLRAPAEATLYVTTPAGAFALPLAELAEGSLVTRLDGRVSAQRVPPSLPLVTGPDQDDFPAAIADGQGGAWLVWVVHRPFGPRVFQALTERPKSFASFKPTGGGDQIRLLHWARGRAGAPIDVTAPGLDVWRPAVALARNGAVVVAWAQFVEGNWDLYTRRYDPSSSQGSEIQRLTTQPGTDTDVALSTAPNGQVWIAWQSWQRGQADILLADLADPSHPTTISESRANDWSPTVAVDSGGRVHVAYDSYQSGSYDVLLRTRESDGSLGPTRIVAGSSLYETKPSVAVDSRNRVWVAYEERTAHWGKDTQSLVIGRGTSLYRASAVRVRCLENGRILEAPDPVAAAPDDVRTLNGFPRLVVDRSGRCALAFRHREELTLGAGLSVLIVGAIWTEYVTTLEPRGWSVPQMLPRSDGLLDNRPALVAPGDGRLVVFYNTDARLRHEVEFTPELSRSYYTHSGTPDGVVDNDLQVAVLTPGKSGAVGEPTLRDLSRRPAEASSPPIHPNEPEDIARMRQYRIIAGGSTYRLLRGEFHRHTELSNDGGNDGALEDMWRYACDVAALEWIGNGDHDNGGSKEYMWWLVQKTTDLYHNPPGLTPLFGYERSVVYPHGHRNVLFAQRGVRTLPRLINEQGTQGDERGVIDADTPMLYDYLKEFGGVCASHTSGTVMGTDWRDMNNELEPFVEIYQGRRNSYEHLGAPRVARRQSEALGGWRPFGMVWNALAMQHKFAFEASSDHISTHISYGITLAEDHTREALIDAFRRRHCYAATDNIVLDVRSGEHLMGDEFTTDRPVTLDIRVHGTAPIARIDIIKDFVYVYSTAPHRARAEFRWTDDERRGPGTSWYYVRVFQDDGEIAWGSPMWVHQEKKTGQ